MNRGAETKLRGVAKRFHDRAVDVRDPIVAMPRDSDQGIELGTNDAVPRSAPLDVLRHEDPSLAGNLFDQAIAK